MKAKPPAADAPAARSRLLPHWHEADLRRLCPAPGWSAVFLRHRADGRWALETEPVLALVLVRSALRHPKRHRTHDRVVHSVQGLTPSTLPRFGRRPGELGAAEDLALPDHALLGYLPPGGTIRDGDRYVRLAEAHIAREAAPPRGRPAGVSDPIAPEVAARVEALLRRPYRMVVRGEPVEGYLAAAPELPGCVTAGETPEEAMELLRDAMRLWLVVAVEDGDAIPDPAPADPAGEL